MNCHLDFEPVKIQFLNQSRRLEVFRRKAEEKKTDFGTKSLPIRPNPSAPTEDRTLAIDK